MKEGEEQRTRENKEEERENICEKWIKTGLPSFIYSLNRFGSLEPNRSEPMPSKPSFVYLLHTSLITACTPLL
jgi:hypothetical protein